MQDVLKVLLSAIAAGTVAACLLWLTASGLSSVASVLGVVLSAGVVAAPVVLCIAGVAFAASKSGY